MERKMKLKLFVLSFVFYSAFLDAGAIIRIDRVDLMNGQKIIFFSEVHIGQINERIDAQYVCNRQRRALDSLFGRMMPFKTNISFYLESNDAIRRLNIATHETTGLFPLTGCEPSYFDSFYLNQMYGRTHWDQVDVVRNFDARTAQDWNLQNSAVMFDALITKYRESGFDKNRFDFLKNKFFNSSVFTPFNDPNNVYTADFSRRLAESIARIQKLVPVEDHPRVLNIGTSRLDKLNAFIVLKQHPRNANKTLFEFLFDMVEQHKENFYPQLSALLTQITQIPTQITSMWDLVFFVSIIADLSLLEAIITDNHRVILISCGARHAQMVIDNFFKNNPRVRAVRSLDMLNQNIIGNLDYAEQAVINFVEQP